jgi:hypothetical protein
VKWAAGAIATVLLGAGLLAHYGRSPAALPAPGAAPPPKAVAAPKDSLADPFSPDRPARLDDGTRAQSSDWVKARPGFQTSRSPAERGGVEPCATQPVDTSAFEPWSRSSQGELLVPRQLPLDASGQFTLVIHLHGNDPVRRELVESGQRFVLYAITLDVGESYAPLFSGPGVRALVAEAEQALTKRAGRPARVGHLVLSAWSAGFVGVEAALARPRSDGPRIDAVVLIDGLHAPRSDAAAFKAQLQPFVDYAQRAAQGDGFFYVSHSSIDPPDFASTTECAHYLVAAVDGKPEAVRREDRFGLELVEYFSRGDFHVRGYAGNDKADHCAQLALLRDVYAELGRRWGSE